MSFPSRDNNEAPTTNKLDLEQTWKYWTSGKPNFESTEPMFGFWNWTEWNKIK